ncbi:MAG: hypothetical protein MUE69_00885 [Myxococcota bacterium]|jgi:hypothetical protein|nr:hypothetical protein [Myxococcota bacterium]
MSTAERPALTSCPNTIQRARWWVEEQREHELLDRDVADVVLQELGRLADGEGIREPRVATVQALAQAEWAERGLMKLDELRTSPRAKELSEEALERLAGLCTRIEEPVGWLRSQAIDYVVSERCMMPPSILGMEPDLADALRGLREALQKARQVRIPEPREKFDRTMEKRFRALAKGIVHAALPTVLAKKVKQAFAQRAYEILKDEKMTDASRHELVSHAMQSSKIDMGASPDALRKREERAKRPK